MTHFLSSPISNKHNDSIEPAPMRGQDRSNDQIELLRLENERLKQNI